MSPVKTYGVAQLTRDYESLEYYLGALRPEREFLRDKELYFFADLNQRHARQGSGILLTVKQWGTLERMYKRLTR